MIKFEFFRFYFFQTLDTFYRNISMFYHMFIPFYYLYSIYIHHYLFWCTLLNKKAHLIFIAT